MEKKKIIIERLKKIEIIKQKGKEDFRILLPHNDNEAVQFSDLSPFFKDVDYVYDNIFPGNEGKKYLEEMDPSFAKELEEIIENSPYFAEPASKKEKKENIKQWFNEWSE